MVPLNDVEPLESKEVSPECEKLPSEEGDFLVLRRVLTTLKAEAEDHWLHHNIFCTRCKAGGKIYTLVIDEDSFKIFVSQDMVAKLGLEPMQHFSPYFVAWIKRGDKIRIRQRCLVNFTMGTNYQHEAWCDVILMDIGHLLLGRPWKYDRGTIHDR